MLVRICFLLAFTLSLSIPAQAQDDVDLFRYWQDRKGYAGFACPARFGRPVFSGRFVKPDCTLEMYLVPGSGDYVLTVILLEGVQEPIKELVMILAVEGMVRIVYFTRNGLKALSGIASFAIVRRGFTGE